MRSYKGQTDVLTEVRVIEISESNEPSIEPLEHLAPYWDPTVVDNTFACEILNISIHNAWRIISRECIEFCSPHNVLCMYVRCIMFKLLLCMKAIEGLQIRGPLCIVLYGNISEGGEYIL